MGREERRNPFGGGSSGGGLRPQTVRDATGRVLEQGDLVVLRTVAEQLWEIAEVKPDLRPGVPANVMLIKLVAVAAFNAPADLPQVEFLRVVSAEERAIQKEIEKEQQKPDIQIVRPAEAEPTTDQTEAAEETDGSEGAPV